MFTCEAALIRTDLVKTAQKQLMIEGQLEMMEIFVVFFPKRSSPKGRNYSFFESAEVQKSVFSAFELDESKIEIFL